jgi:hypothetical protein
MTLDISIQVENLDKVADAFGRLGTREAKVAFAKALNDTGFMVRRAMQAELGKFDRVTPFIQRSPKLVAATPDKLSARIIPTMDSRNLPSAGGKVGVDPQDVLQAQEFGGRRADKRSESVLRRAGLLPNGFQTAIPTDPYPGSADGRGNMRGAFLQQLLAYLQAYNVAGMANMTAKRKGNIQRGTAKTRGRRYFVSYGRLRGQHLAPGIWAAQGTSGSDVRPVLMFVRRPSYTPRISMDRVARDSGAQEFLDRRVRFRVREAADA